VSLTEELSKVTKKNFLHAPGFEPINFEEYCGKFMKCWQVVLQVETSFLSAVLVFCFSRKLRT
jgi:hypothetical protein